MKMRALITGFPGQDACYLAKFLLEHGYEVHGMMKRYTAPNYSNMEYLGLMDDVQFHVGDVTDIGSIFNILREAKPTEFYNLAAQSYVGDSWQLAHATSQVDGLGPLNCLTAIQNFDPEIRFYQAGTSEMFGNANNNGFQDEDTPFMPVSPYGVSKLFGYHITKNFRESHDAHACSGILFNHESPIRGIQFVTRKITHAAARLYHGEKFTLELGNLDARRDWGHAEDFVRGMWMMLQQDEPKDYIIATGKSNTVREVLEIAFIHANLDPADVMINQKYIRPNELHALHANSTKANEELGWKPKWSFKDMIQHMVEEDIKRLRFSN